MERKLIVMAFKKRHFETWKLFEMSSDTIQKTQNAFKQSQQQ